MNKAEELLELAAQEGIDVHREKLALPGHRALYLRWRDQAVILHDAESQSELACLLAEELGHHSTAPRLRIHYHTMEGIKAEARARRWAHRRLLPISLIQEAYAAGMRERWELAEYLDVTEPFLQEALEDYQAAGLLKFKKRPEP